MTFFSMMAMQQAAAPVSHVAPIPEPDLLVYSAAEADSFVNFGRPGGIGDMILWHSDLENAAGERVGDNGGNCIRLDAAGSYMCSFQLQVDGRGQLVFSGVQRPEPAVSELPITGGTGDFSGAVGRVLSQPVENRARFEYRIEFADR